MNKKASTLYRLVLSVCITVFCSASPALTISLPGDGYSRADNVTINRSLSYDYNGGSEVVIPTAIGNSFVRLDNYRVSASWMSWKRILVQGDYTKAELTVDKNMTVYGRSGRINSPTLWSWGQGEIIIDIQQSGVPVSVSMQGSSKTGVEGGKGTFKIAIGNGRLVTVCLVGL